MANLFFRSMLVLALLFGLLFAVGMVILTAIDAPVWMAVIFGLGILFLQYLLGPWILQLIYKIEWRDPQSIDPNLAEFIGRVCAERRIPVPHFGVIHDGNPTAFTFGHYPGDARLVVTTGLLELLDQKEHQAVVAHELGHIVHWDFVVMTVAAAIPLILYILSRVALSGRGRGKGGGYLALVGILSYVAYLVSQFIALLLSRVREYYADQFASEVTGNPNALSSALVKVAYGLAAAPKDSKKKDDVRMTAARAFGIFDPRAAQSLALAGAGSGPVSVESMENAMKWDLWNPWAKLFELSSTHPLPAKRIRALERQSEANGQLPQFSFRAEQPESYWDEFLVDAFINYLPPIALLAALAWAAISAYTLRFSIGGVGLALLLVSLAWWLKRRFSYRRGFDDRRAVSSLIGEVKVSAVRSIPCTLEGHIIGRGVPGLFYSEDLVLQDNTGYIVVDYRQPLGILEFLFGWLKAGELIGRRGKVMGWYRRSPRPYVELRKMILEDGKTITSYSYPVAQFLVYAGILLGAILLIAQFVLLR